MTLPKHRTATRPHGHVRYQMGPNENGQPGKGCRCHTCRRANCRAASLYRLRVLQLGGKLTVPADPVRDHVHALLAHGLTTPAIAAAAHIPHITVRKLLNGQPSRGTPPTRRVTRKTANALLNVPYSYLPDQGLAPAVGTQRRLRALTAVGWPTLTLAARLDMPSERLFRLQTQQRHRIKATFAHAVRDLYDELWDADPTQHGVPAHLVESTRRRAQKYGWALPMQWDDDEIDNPHAAPYLDQEGQVWLRHATNGRRLIDEHSLTIAQAAQQLGISAGHLNNCLTKMRAQSKEPAA